MGHCSSFSIVSCDKKYKKKLLRARSCLPCFARLHSLISYPPSLTPLDDAHDATLSIFRAKLLLDELFTDHFSKTASGRGPADTHTRELFFILFINISSLLFISFLLPSEPMVWADRARTVSADCCARQFCFRVMRASSCEVCQHKFVQ